MDRKIVNNYIYNICFQIIAVLIALIMTPYIARVLSVEQIGIYSYVTSVSNFIVTFTIIGTYSYGCRQIAYVRDDSNLCNQVYNQIWSLRIILCLFCSTIYIIAMYVFEQYTQAFAFQYFWVLSMFIDPSWFFVGQENMKITTLKNSVVKLSGIILVFTFVRSEDDLIKYVFIMASAALISNITLYTQLKKYHIKQQFTLSNWKKHCLQSLKFFWPQVATLVYLQVDKLMLALLLDNMEELAFYDYGEKIVTIPLTFITVLSTVLMPRIANEYGKNNKIAISELIKKSGKISMLLAMPMMIGLILCISTLVPWYLGIAYKPIILVVMIVSPIVVTHTLSGISSNQYFVATNQMNYVMKASVITAIVNIVLNALLIPYYGCYGAAIATTISSIFSVVIQYSDLQKQINMIPLFKNAVIYFVLSIPMACSVAIINFCFGETYKITLLQMVLGGLVYLLTLLVVKDDIILAGIEKLKMLLKKSNKGGHDRYEN